MSPQSPTDRSEIITHILLRIVKLREEGADPETKDFCGGDHELEQEVGEQLTCVESIDQLLQAATNTYNPERDQQVVTVSECSVIPQKLDRYVIKKLLGQGGFGQVWLAHDPDLNLNVAVKIPRPDRHFTEVELELFLHEAQKAAAIDGHPNIVRIRDIQRRGKTCFIVSDYVEGMSLAERLKAGRLLHEEIRDVVAGVADALHHAHLRGFVHRDVKPENILLDRNGKPHLADFGLAVSEEEQLKEEAAVRGTIAYMAPEQARGESHLVDSRTDVYGLGVVLYQLLTQRLPYIASSQKQYLEQICHRDPRPPRTIDDSIPAELESICLKSLRKERADRFTTAKDLATALRHWKPQQSRRLLTLTVWTAMAVAMAVALVTVWLRGREYPPPDRTEGDPKVESAGHSHLDMDRTVLKPGEWHSLLQWEPRPLYFPEELHWKPGSPYLIHTDDWGMIAFGKLPRSPCRLKVNFKQSPWHGNVSVFFGYHETTSADFVRRKIARYQFIHVFPWAAVQNLKLERGYAVDYGVDKVGRVLTPVPLNDGAVLDFPEGRFYTLEFTVDHEGLSEVEWDGAKLSLGKAEVNKQLLDMDPRFYQGYFGIQTLNATTQIKDFQIKLLPGGRGKR